MEHSVLLRCGSRKPHGQPIKVLATPRTNLTVGFACFGQSSYVYVRLDGKEVGKSIVVTTGVATPFEGRDNKDNYRSGE